MIFPLTVLYPKFCAAFQFFHRFGLCGTFCSRWLALDKLFFICPGTLLNEIDSKTKNSGTSRHDRFGSKAAEIDT
jgi:hypothetical protein